MVRAKIYMNRCSLFIIMLLPMVYLQPYIRHHGSIHYQHLDGTSHILAWSVKLQRNQSELAHSADTVAQQLGLNNHGEIGHIKNYFLFVHPFYYNVSANESDEPILGNCHNQSFYSTSTLLYLCAKNETEYRLDQHPAVIWYKQEVMRSRSKRMLTFQDPSFPQQWHLLNSHTDGMDLNVTGLWTRNITGRGVTVCVVDDGLEWTNADLRDNYSPEGSWDLNDNDQDPMPPKDGKRNEHGTRCAGEIAAVNNNFCGVGVAFEAWISGLKVLDGKMTDSMEATAFNKNMEINDIYSCSWGPEDDGSTIDGPHELSTLALENGINSGRKGYGTIYVVASGNGGLSNDNCNYDGYANSIYTITIGAVDEYGKVPFYAEECAAALVVTFSSGGKGDRNIVTTDWTVVDSSGCTNEHTGTSAAAPLAAGVIALMLQVRPCLSWRDVQYLLILSAVQVNIENSTWHINAAGLHHSNQYGFGLLSAWNAVSAAKVWPSVPWLSTFTTSAIKAGNVIPFHPGSVNLVFNVTESMIKPYFIWILEYVRVRITMPHPSRGSIEFRLRCPSGSESVLATPRINDKSSEGLKDWTFSTVRCWGEKPVGEWVLKLTDWGIGNATLGRIDEWRLILHGTPMTSSELQDRIRLVKDAADGNVLDDDSDPLPCQLPQQALGGAKVMADKILKILTLTGGFLFVLAVFETLEYMFCYNEEKRKFFMETASARGPEESEKSEVEEMPLLCETADDEGNAIEMHCLTPSTTAISLDYGNEIPEGNNARQSCGILDNKQMEPADNGNIEIPLVALHSLHVTSNEIPLHESSAT